MRILIYLAFAVCAFAQLKFDGVQVDGVETDSNLVFDAPLTSSIAPRKGTLSSFTRATTATRRTHNGFIESVKSGEARFCGARRVENLLRYPENITTGNGWSASPPKTATSPLGVANDAYDIVLSTANAGLYYTPGNKIIGKRYVASCWMRANSGTPTVRIELGNYKGARDVVVTGTWQRFQSYVYDATVAEAVFFEIRTDLIPSPANADIEVWHPQIEIVDPNGLSASEYVSVDVLSSSYHGANVDGVKYFDTHNGNTVDANGVVTEGTGAPLQACGYLGESSVQNTLTYSQQMHNTTAWPTVTGSIVTNSTVCLAPDRTATATGHVLPAEGCSHYITQNMTIVSNNVYTLSVFVNKNKLSPSNATHLELTTINSAYQRAWFNLMNYTAGTAVGQVASIERFANGWIRCSISYRATTSTTAPAYFSLRPSDGSTGNVSGDGTTVDTYFWGAQFESGVYGAMSYVPTVATAVTRNHDVLTYISPSDASSAGTVLATIRRTILANGSFIQTIYPRLISNSTPAVSMLKLNEFSHAVDAYDGVANTTSAPNSFNRDLVNIAGSRYGGGTHSVVINGTATVPLSYAGTYFNGATFVIGNNPSHGQAGGVAIRDVKIWNKSLSEETMKSLTKRQ